jgi:uncharacterized protein
VNVSDNAPGSAQAIPLSGTAVQATVSILPETLEFGSQSVGTSSAAVPVTLQNTGGTGSILQITSISLAGTNPGDFSETNSCTGAGISIPAASICKIEVTFSPVCSTSMAARKATLNVADNTADSPQSIPISGTAGGQFCMDSSGPGATTATVVAGQTATYQLNIVSMDNFAGSVAMACTEAPAASTCGVSPSPVPVTGNSTSVFQVSVATLRSTMLSPVRRLEFDPNAKLPLLLSAFAVLGAACILLRRPPRTRIGRFAFSRFGRNRFAQAGVLALFFAVVFAACGGGGGTSPGEATTGTPAGTYSLTVTGTVAGAKQTIQLTLVVQ